MSQNDKTLIDMAVTNAIHIRAMMAYLKEHHDAPLQQFIDAEIQKRTDEIASMKEAESKAKEQLKAALESGPPEPNAPLVFGGDVEPTEGGEADVVGESSESEDHPQE